MKAERGASQVLFGLLPGQTADLEGRVWRVAEWVDPEPIGLDQAAVRAVIINALAPWTQAGTDNGLAAELRTRSSVEIVRLNMDRGVRVEQFPCQWRCKSCGRIEDSCEHDCACGTHRWAQMQFVAYHDCGFSREPFIPRCRTHHAVGVRLPGTATARELLFFCPVCGATLSQGFPFQKCSCGGSMSITVHRAAVVFSPRFAVLVNPPDPTVATQLRASGGGARALDWVLEGMREADPTKGRQTLAGLVETLLQAGLSEETAQELARQAAARGEVDSGDTGPLVVLPGGVRREPTRRP